MARKKPLSSEEILKEEIRLTQEIINCDNWIAKLHTEPFLQAGWIDKKEQFENDLHILKQDLP